MTKKEAAIVAAYTGYLIGEFAEMHKYIEEIMERPVWTHEMANEEFMNKLREKTRKDFINMKVE